jgi:formylmethanofuran dehydrogenase subunit E
MSETSACPLFSRARFGTRLIGPRLRESDFVVRRISSGKPVRVVIDAAPYPRDVHMPMNKIESGKSEPADSAFSKACNGRTLTNA